MTYVWLLRLWNGHMYLAKFLLVGGATMLVFGVCVCVCVFLRQKNAGSMFEILPWPLVGEEERKYTVYGGFPKMVVPNNHEFSY